MSQSQFVRTLFLIFAAIVAVLAGLTIWSLTENVAYSGLSILELDWYAAFGFACLILMFVFAIAAVLNPMLLWLSLLAFAAFVGLRVAVGMDGVTWNGAEVITLLCLAAVTGVLTIWMRHANISQKLVHSSHAEEF